MPAIPAITSMKKIMNWLNDSGVTTNRNQKFAFAKQ